MLLKFLSWVKTSKWALYALAGAVVAFLTLLLRSLFTNPGDKDHANFTLPPAPQVLQDAVAAAEEAALTSRIQASATTDAHVDQLNKIAAIPDGAERRKQMAGLLNTL